MERQLKKDLEAIGTASEKIFPKEQANRDEDVKMAKNKFEEKMMERAFEKKRK